MKTETSSSNRVLLHGVNRVLLHDPTRGLWLRFDDAEEIVVARTVGQVLPALRRVEEHADASGWAAGFVSYDAAPAFDRANCVRPGVVAPLVWFGLFDRPTILRQLPQRPASCTIGDWVPAVSKAGYAESIDRIRGLIRAGDTYQVNYTFPLIADFEGDPEALFARLVRAQPGGYAALIETGSFAACSVSPELFFELNGDSIRSRPMKGTRRRGVNARDDARLREQLRASEKDRAENLMVVDMIRSDLGRIANAGSVHVADLFSVETYRTVLQMTSTVGASTSASLSDIFRALFPCASITGAPKVRTTEIISELESEPRGLYTGAIGYTAPGRRSRFSVAIRTVQLDLQRGVARYDVGGGIVWDSKADDEYAECRTKAGVLLNPGDSFSLIETMRYEPDRGIVLMRRHLDRLEGSAAFFDYPADRAALERALAKFSSVETTRIRLTLNSDGSFALKATPMRRSHRSPVVLGFAEHPVDPDDRLLYHKTTSRELYDRALQSAGGQVDDAILHAPDGKVTETCRANIAIRVGDKMLTPPEDVGLLPGVLRGHLVDRRSLVESYMTVDDVADADEVFVISALRGVRRAEIKPRRRR